MNADSKRKLSAIVALAIAFGFVLAGAARTHRAYTQDGDTFGLLTFDKVSERQLVVDSTFTGVERRNGRLFSTYDRTVERGKRACPT